MSRRLRLPNIEGLTWLGQDGTEDKVNLYREGGARLLRKIIDWDDTYVPREYIAWNIMKRVLPPEKQEEHRKLYQEYHPLEKAGKLDVGKIQWSGEALRLQVGVSLDDVDREVDGAQLNPHAIESFATSRRAGVPISVLTSGLAYIVERMISKKILQGQPLEEAGISVRGIRWRTRNRKIYKWNAQSLIDTGLKSEDDHPALVAIRDERPHALVIGDQLPDGNMVSGKDNAVRIRIINAPIGSSEWHEERDKSQQAGFDAIAPNLPPPTELERWFVGEQDLLPPDR